VLKYVPSQEAVSQRKAGRWFEFLGISSRLQDTASWKKKQTDYLPGFLMGTGQKDEQCGLNM